MKYLKRWPQLVSAATLAFWLTAGGSRAADRPCGEDIAKHCSDIERGEGRVLNCLRTHHDELSDKCKIALEGPCAADRKRFCEGHASGIVQLKACMKEHEAEISGQCKAAMDKLGSQ